MTASGVYVYAVVRADHPLPADARPVGGPPARPRLLAEGPLAAVISEAPARLRACRADLTAHQDMLLRLAQDGPVLPMRFGAVATGRRAVRRELAEASDSRLRALERLTDRVEFNVKALPASDALAALLAQDERVRRLRDSARLRPGYEANLRLGEAVAAALTRRASEAGGRAVRELAALACETAVGPDVPGCALNVSFLVDRSDGERFGAAVRGFAEQCREQAELRLAGPLPCYSFVAADGALLPAGA